MQNYKKIGFLSELNPKDRKSWSGTLYKIYESIENAGYKVEYVAIKRSIYIAFILKIFNKISRFLNKNFSYSHTFLNVKSIKLEKDIDSKYDILFVIGASVLSKLKTKRPVIYLIDATFNSLYNYYPDFSNFWHFNIYQGNEIEKLALKKASQIIAASDWTMKSIIKDYHISPDKVKVIEFGANVDAHDVIHKNKKEVFNVLFLGVEWNRKGGDIAVQTCDMLIGMGHNICFNVVGIKDLPAIYNSKEWINNIGFLNKNTINDYNKFVDVISSSDILLLPTKAECAGIAFAEASAYRLPIFTYDTGGIANYVINGVNGYRLPLESIPLDFANRIKQCIEDGEIEILKKGCTKMYETKLNWVVWSEKFKVLVNEDMMKKM